MNLYLRDFEQRIIEAIISVLPDNDRDVRTSVVQVLQNQELTPTNIESIIKHLGNSNSDVCSSAAEALAKITVFTPTMMESLTNYLGDRYKCEHVLGILSNVQEVTPTLIESLIKTIEGNDYFAVQSKAVRIISKASVKTFTPTLVETILNLLSPQNKKVSSLTRPSIVKLLGKLIPESENTPIIIDRLIQCLYGSLRGKTIAVLSKVNLSLTNIEQIFQSLSLDPDDDHDSIRCAAIELLGASITKIGAQLHNFVAVLLKLRTYPYRRVPKPEVAIVISDNDALLMEKYIQSSSEEVAAFLSRLLHSYNEKLKSFPTE